MEVFLDDIISGIFLVLSIVFIALGFFLYRHNRRKYPVSLLITGVIVLAGSLYWAITVLSDLQREFLIPVIIWSIGAISLAITIVLWRSGK